jgi:hypothetical protein
MTKLIDHLNELKATADDRAKAKAEQERRDREEAERSEIRLGKEEAERVIPSFEQRILTRAEDNETALEVPVQSSSQTKALTLWEAAYTTTITQYFEDQGLRVEQVQTASRVAGPKRYNTILRITW